MALKEKGNFGINLEDQFRDIESVAAVTPVKKTSLHIITHAHEDVNTHKHTHTHAHEDVNTHKHTHTQEHEPVAKVKKSRRIQILTFDSLVDRIDAYAKKRGVSRAKVFEVAMEKFLSDLGE